MVLSVERVSRVIGDIYAAVDGPEGFTPVVSSVRQLLNGSGGVLLTPEADPATQGFAYVDHFNLELFARYPAEFLDRDVWLSEARRRQLLQPGKVLTNEMVISDEAFRALPIYHEVFVPNDGIRVCCGVVAGERDPLFPLVYLSIFRGVNSEPFGDEERRLVGLLTPHLAQALRLTRSLVAARQRAGESCQALHELACGVILLDGKGVVLFMNRAAEHLCSGARGLRVEGGRAPGQCRVTCVLPAAQRALCALIGAAVEAAACAGRDLPRASACEPLVVRGASGPPLLVSAVALPSEAGGFGVEATRAVLLLEDPTGRKVPAERVLAGLFGLTPAESRVARALVEGLRPKAIAFDLAVSEHTVRTHIRALYRKTGTRGMSALIGLLASLSSRRAEPEP